MKHKTKNRLIKKRKTKKRKMKMRGGGILDYFMSSSVYIPGFGPAGRCQSKQYFDPKYGELEQKCYITPAGEIYKTQYPDSGAANSAADGSASGTATPTKSWYQFW